MKPYPPLQVAAAFVGILCSLPVQAQTTPVAPLAPPTATAPATPAIRVACVGDSITYGSGTTNPKQQSYPAQLSRLLGSGYIVGNFGVGGATLLDEGDKPYRRQKAFAQAQAFHPDIVVILLGTNDSKPQNWQHKDRFVPDYESLVGQFVGLTPSPKVLIGYPIVVAGQGNYGINEVGVEEAMRMIDRIATDEKVTVIDAHKTLQGKESLIPDRVHPNNVGAGMLAKAVYQALMGREFVGPVPPPAPLVPAAPPVTQTPPVTTAP